jgi:hypothetical protein
MNASVDPGLFLAVLYFVSGYSLNKIFTRPSGQFPRACQCCTNPRRSCRRLRSFDLEKTKSKDRPNAARAFGSSYGRAGEDSYQWQCGR